MKKICLSIFAVLLLCVVTLSGCAKADSASLKDCYNLYQDLTAEYSTSTKYLYAGETNKQVDLYSQTAYNQYAYQKIQAEAGNFKLLKYGKQFQVLTETALSFYDNYDAYLNMQDIISYENKVSQEQKSKLYRAIDDFSANCDEIVKSKSALVTLCYSGFSVDNINVLNNLKNFVKSYKNFIGKALEISIAFEDIYTTGMVAEVKNGIDTGEGARLVESAKLYIAKYVYIQYIANQDVYYDCTSQSTYLALLDLIKGDAITFSNKPTQSEINTYNFLCEKLNNFKTALKNFEIAKQKENSNQTYKDYVANFEQVVLDFATCIKTNLINN